MSRPYVYLDLGFYGPCNLKCTYCRSSVVRDRGMLALDQAERIVDVFLSRHRAAVAKTSGYGEITIWKQFEELLELLAARFPVVQIITNGTFGHRVAELMLSTSSVSPNFTLDGHTLELNGLRVEGRKTVHQRILENLRLLTENGKRVEVNCVLHERNASGLTQFCDYLAERFAGRVMLFPFPARSFSLAPGIGTQVAATLARYADDIERLGETHAAVLPPAPYIGELARFVRGGVRDSPCYVHWLNAGCGPRQERLHCANYGEDLAYGPMDSASPELHEMIAVHEAAHFAAGRVGPRCDDCFNHFHILGMYLAGRLPLEELLTVPSLSFEGVGEILLEVKALFERGAGSAVRDEPGSRPAPTPSDVPS